MSSEKSITVSNIGKLYQIYKQPQDRLKQALQPRLARLTGNSPRKYYDEFWALRNISFEVPRGKTLGVIGQNGSGKSTLLQIICGTLTPTEGEVITNGRIGALLELGSGFNPEFTGRENVFLNAAIIGLTRQETEDRFDAIASFADIGDFLDRPIKTYSSGMAVRLAFAVQAQIDPEILIVDEALAVGDAKFQAKCFERLKQLKRNGTSILLVTHTTEQIVSHCDEAILLHEGHSINMGLPRQVVNRYFDILFGKPVITSAPGTRSESDAQAEREAGPQRGELNFNEDEFHTHAGYNTHEYRWGDKAALILDYWMTSGDKAYPSSVETGTPLTIKIAVQFRRTIIRPVFGLTIKTKEGITVYGVNTVDNAPEHIDDIGNANTVAQISFEFVSRLAPGDYFVSLGVASMQAGELVPHDRRYDSIHLQIEPSQKFHGLADLSASIQIDS